jgi:hypothetical protein
MCLPFYAIDIPQLQKMNPFALQSPIIMDCGAPKWNLMQDRISNYLISLCAEGALECGSLLPPFKPQS